ncbi:hypothetical protein PWT90_04731 [Aphanocladium album]|nr:hypothetical protein PWT90_04731 [Aphanocladium album]
MRFSTIAVAAAATVANAQRPTDTPICDYYTTALLKNNTAENQATLLTLLVNTVVIGNYTMPNVGVSVPGILKEGEVDGTKVALAPYFSGALASTNRNDKPTCVNFLDGGGAEPLMKNMAANDDKSNQHFLLTHLYQFFGTLLGCSKQGMAGFDAYDSAPSMYKVHKFMNLGNAEMTYFITQVGMAAASFGVAKEDIAIVAKALGDTFNMRCSAPVEVIKGKGPQPQAICIKSDCTEAKDAKCDVYAKAEAPAKCSGSTTSGAAMPTSTGGMKPTTTGSNPTSTAPPTGAGNVNGLGVAAVLAAAAAYVL